MNTDRLDALIELHLNGTLTDAERLELEEYLRRSAADRARFWELAEAHALLHQCFSQKVTESAPVVKPLRKSWRPSRLAIVAAACVLIAVKLMTDFSRVSNDQPKPLAEPTSSAIATLTRAVNVEWENGSTAYEPGDALEPGLLRLKSGMAQIEFFNGARVLIEGPVELKLISSTEAFCQSGKLSAEVPQQARGFAIGTPQMRVVDLGTAFGLDVQPRGAEVHVFKGKVEVHKDDMPTRGLNEGEAMSMASDGKVNTMPMNLASFATAEDFTRKSTEAQERRQAAWRTAGQARIKDPSLLLRYDFENLAPSDNELKNRSLQHAEITGGRIVGCEHVEGRWQNKGALEFRGVGDRVRLEVPGELRSVTMAVWVRVDALDRPYQSLLMSEGFDAGALHWQINQKGVIHMGVQGPENKNSRDYGSPAFFKPERLDRWTHLAVTFDVDAKTVTHFVDGQPTASEAIRTPVPLHIGKADIGNWTVGTRGTIYPVRHFSGRMDEFNLYNRALNSSEILALYSEGSPQTRTTP